MLVRCVLMISCAADRLWVAYIAWAISTRQAIFRQACVATRGELDARGFSTNLACTA